MLIFGNRRPGMEASYPTRTKTARSYWIGSCVVSWMRAPFSASYLLHKKTMPMQSP